jgi:hypothetical protein
VKSGENQDVSNQNIKEALQSVKGNSRHHDQQTDDKQKFPEADDVAQ